MSRSDDTYASSFVWRIRTMPFVLAIAYLVWPEVMPYGFLELWTPKGSTEEAWTIALGPLLLWAVVLQTGVAIKQWYDLRRGPKPMDVLVGGFLASIWAGFVEEILFRWLLFLSAIALAVFGNWLIFGFVGQGYGVVEWWHNNLFGPIANFMTFGYLAEYLARPDAWSIGVALLVMNGFFRNGHAYQGLIGFVNSWFVGMYFFWLTLTFGLLGAIVAHFAYDLVVAVTLAVLHAIAQHRRRAWG